MLSHIAARPSPGAKCPAFQGAVKMKTTIIIATVKTGVIVMI